MKQFLLALLLSFSITTVYAARNPLLPLCGLGAAYDSYGQGIEAGFRGKNLRPTLHEQCYRLGVREGAAVARQGEFGCTKSFDEGYQAGFQGANSYETSDCYLAGVQAGSSALDRGASDVIPLEP